MKKKLSRLARELWFAVTAIQNAEWFADKTELILQLLGVAFNYVLTYDATMERSLRSQTWPMGLHPHSRDA